MIEKIFKNIKYDKYVFEDLERENEICNYLFCDYIILYDRTH